MGNYEWKANRLDMKSSCPRLLIIQPSTPLKSLLEPYPGSLLLYSLNTAWFKEKQKLAPTTIFKKLKLDNKTLKTAATLICKQRKKQEVSRQVLLADLHTCTSAISFLDNKMHFWSVNAQAKNPVTRLLL